MQERNTVQRQLVYHAVQELACHPTADEVYEAVISTHPTVSKATVYRNLNKLADAGFLRKIQVPNAADRYDTTTPAHYHVYCRECGSFEDVDLPYLLTIDREVERDTGYQLDDHDIVFSGVCPDCSTK